MGRRRKQLAGIAMALSVIGCSDRSAVSNGPGGDGAASEAGTSDGLPEAAADLSPSGPCPVVRYTPCGGVLLGSWRFLSFCPEDLAAAKALFEHPYDDRPACSDRAENPVDGQIDTTGTLSFDETSLTIDTTGQMKVSYGFSDACLAVVQPGVPAAQACASLANNGRLQCTFDANRRPACTCSATLPTDPMTGTAAYSRLSETTIEMDGRRATYCVAGDRLTMDWDPHPVSWRYWVLGRQ